MRLTDVLKQFALVGDAEIEEALKAQKKDKEGLRIGELLCNLGYCSEDQIHWALSQHLNLPYIHVDEVDIDYNAISFFPVAMLKRLGALPLFSDDDGVAIALIDPTDDKAKDELSEYSGQVVKVCMANAKEIRSFLADLEETQIVHLKEVKPLEEEPKEQLEAVSQLWLKVHELWFEKQVRGILEGVSTAELTKKIKAFCPDFSFRPGCSFWEGKSSEQVFWVQITPEFLRLKSAINLDSKIIEKNILKPSPGKWAELNTPSPEKAFVAFVNYLRENNLKGYWIGKKYPFISKSFCYLSEYPHWPDEVDAVASFDQNLIDNMLPEAVSGHIFTLKK